MINKKQKTKKAQQDSLIKNVLWIIFVLIILGLAYFITKSLFNGAG
jgi:hypothetical protein